MKLPYARGSFIFVFSVKTHNAMKLKYFVPECDVMELQSAGPLCQSGRSTESFGVFVTLFNDDDFN